jgi:rRNA processing protein Krr1/Pno1
MIPLPDDNDEKHVLIVGETEDSVNRAQFLIEKIIYADDATRNRIKEEQQKASNDDMYKLFDLNGRPMNPEIEEHMMTPYGPPNRNARILPIPNDCVRLIIGKNCETIRRLNNETGCKIQIAKKEIPNTDVRNVFIEGPPEKYENAKKQIEEIVSEQIFLKHNFSQIGDINPFPGPHTPIRIPNKMVGLIIGRNGENIRNLYQKTDCLIFIPKESMPGQDFRELEISGPPDGVEICKREITSLIHLTLYGKLPYFNSLFYPFIDPISGLPIIDSGIMAQLDPNAQYTYDNYAQFENIIFEKSNPQQRNSYIIDDYTNPTNYDLYYQSLYQMYPQLSDYYKKAQETSHIHNNQNSPYVLFNTDILDPKINTEYDPNYLSGYVNSGEESKFDYSNIDYNRYIDNIYNCKESRIHYDKNADDENVNLYYETYYKELSIDINQPLANIVNTAIEVPLVREEFKKPFIKVERRRRSRFDEVDPNLISNNHLSKCI